MEEIYQAYNARHLNPEEVAESFIWSSNFEKLIQNGHSVILGARGCGKTTLMKMLTLPALYAWKDKRAVKIQQDLPFYAIYISTDIYWDVKNFLFAEQLEKYGKFSEVISIFSVNTNVFTSLCDTFSYIISQNNHWNNEKETELCIELIEAWKLSNVIPKLSFVKEALNKRVDDVNQLIQSIIFNNYVGDTIPHYSYFNLTFESSVELIIPIFERIYDIVNLKKWALCFDELEFAPQWLQVKLFKSLRSRKQFILYKLSASPILSSEVENLVKTDYGPSSGNDLQIIKMWGTADSEVFSKKVIDSLLKNKFGKIETEDFFGTNEIYNSSSIYQKSSNFYKELVELSQKDDAFRNFLIKNKVNPDDPSFSDKGKKDTLFRKIKPIVYYRNFFIQDNNGNKVNYRSRKIVDLYSGIEVLSKICDGNPRWLIGIVNSILAKATNKGVQKEVQYSELYNAALKFKNVIANIPIGNNSTVSLINIIDKVGEYFKHQLLGPKFQMDPKGTFIVDINSEEISDVVIVLLEKAISQGGIILVDSNDDNFDFEVRNQRFKLSYLLCLLYNLPLRVYPFVKLSECLKGIQSTNQKSLFD